MKKLIAFDLDGTLAESKSHISDEMADLLVRLLANYQICIISGCKFEQFEKQVLNKLKCNSSYLYNLHLMPTCGAAYYTFHYKWNKIYSEEFSLTEKKKIISVLNQSFFDLQYVEDMVYGDTIDDRGCQITYSALGQDVVTELGELGLKLKSEWDPSNQKKLKLRNYISELLPEFEVKMGGSTSIDVTKKGIDKAYGMLKLINILELATNDVLFIGDRLQPGGNDYPVKELGIDCLEVKSVYETANLIRLLLF